VTTGGGHPDTHGRLEPSVGPSTPSGVSSANPGATAALSAQTEACRALSAENERLRARTHEIAEQADQRYAPYVRRCAEMDRRVEAAASLVESWSANNPQHWSTADRDAILALIAERDAALAVIAEVRMLAGRWKYKGEFGWGPWQSGEGPGPEDAVLDECATDILVLLPDAAAAPKEPTP